MAAERKTLTQLSVPICLETLFYMLSGMVDTLMLSSVSDQAVGAVGTANTYIGVFIIMFGVISSGMVAVMSQNIGAGRPGVAYQARQLGLMFNALIGVLMAKLALELMGTPDDVINLSTLYMRIYFLGMPFFMLYNYGAAVLRAVGDTKRPLMFLIAAGIINACLNMVLVIVFNLGVAGVAIATIFSQFISCVLVLRCLNKTDASYQLRFSKLKIKGYYLKQIFQVGIPAGIQSTVINFSNALLQSSVNSFGSTAMAGYTAANNILGFLYASINSVTQACMSFTSQNYGVRKFKRMDKVLIDCVILSVGASLVFGCGAYIFGDKVLMIYTNSEDVIKCGVEILSITTVPYFLCGIMDLFPGALRGMGYSLVPMILSVIGTVGMRIFWIFVIFPSHRTLYDLFISYPASWTATIIMQVICFLVVRRKVHSQINK